jgi:putative nucleic acid modification protein with dual OB domain
MPVDEIVVLACSKKWGGRCVAGISRKSGRWLRPVSRLPHGELTPYHYRIDGREIEPLDVVRLEHMHGLDDPTQPENVAVGDSRWQLIGNLDSVTANEVFSRHLVDGPALLGNRGGALTEEDAMRGVDASLALVRPTEVEFHLEPPWEGTSRARPRVSFELSRQSYDLALTDYRVAPRLMRAGLGSHGFAGLGIPSTAGIYLTVSLAEARDGWCTKLAAAVLTLPQEV